MLELATLGSLLLACMHLLAVTSSGEAKVGDTALCALGLPGQGQGLVPGPTGPQHWVK